MSRLLVHVEGQTEETFVNEILGPHLLSHGYTSISARLLGNSRNRLRRGGIRAWQAVRKDIINHLQGDPNCLSTTMVDYYALPRTGNNAWPGCDQAALLPFPENAKKVESAMTVDVCNQLGDHFDPKRFIPYIMMHEFEALLFSDCEKFARGIERPDLVQNLQEIRLQFATPEEINDSPQTAPSQRLKTLMPGYSKILFGKLAILEIGLDAIREECPHFKQWLGQLETCLR
ncbi:DUF4276 family protein [Gloeobacter violaceus]|uniref:Gll1842 protein n=1 Tax=Gloeobacter violaceus (strain ATCC 29082 / PCC 7421) TaxID=251221 RepID=Q7NJJ0_GLOVI|nr:DUF4276 family protein [Gloeobacter violaceus]BAC89783.1 gll1842 [Gloeobacter violaceus PCC 7421]